MGERIGVDKRSRLGGQNGRRLRVVIGLRRAASGDGYESWGPGPGEEGVLLRPDDHENDNDEDNHEDDDHEDNDEDDDRREDEREEEDDNDDDREEDMYKEEHPKMDRQDGKYFHYTTVLLVPKQNDPNKCAVLSSAQNSRVIEPSRNGNSREEKVAGTIIAVL